MMKKLLAGCTAAALASSLSPALAQTAPPPGVSQGTSMPSPMLTPHVPPVIRGPRAVNIRMHDEVMTRDQMLQHVREMFAKLDTNHDGFITKDEVASFEAKMRAMHMGARVRERFQEGRFERQGAVHEENRAALFDKLDTNHDGVISRQEFMAIRPDVHERRVMVMREGNDTHAGGPMGKGHMHEMHMRQMGMHGSFAAHLFAMADTNHDGRVSLQEAEAAMLAHFDRMDLNHDGKITPEERQQAHERMREEHHPF